MSIDGVLNSKVRLGDLLIDAGLLKQEQLSEALSLQKSSGSRLGDIILEKGWVRAFDFYQALAHHFNLPFVNFSKDAPDKVLFNVAHIADYRRLSLMPWQKRDGTTLIAISDPGKETVDYIQKHYKGAVNLVITTKFDIAMALRPYSDEGQGTAVGTILSSKVRFGDVLMASGLISQEQLDKALVLQKKWGSKIGDIIIAKGWVRAFDFYQALAAHFDRPFVNLMKKPPTQDIINKELVTEYSIYGFIPWRVVDGKLHLAVADPSEETLQLIRDKYGNDVELVVTSKFDIMWHLQDSSNDFLSSMAVNDLAAQNPRQSARKVFTKTQLAFITGVVLLTILALSIWPVGTVIYINIFISIFLLLNFGLRMTLVWVGGDRKIDVKVSDEEVQQVVDAGLPIYTVLVPMYKEAKVLPLIAGSLRSLDYPLSKLDIKLVLEEDDDETIDTAKSLGLEGIFEIIRVPKSLPKTKPKACNYALRFARGKYVTIYDAEDKPEPDQLKKVVAAFAKASENTVVIQARLNYFNHHENWLTRLFTLEYSLWFDFFLPALEVLRIPIPLGGTSNHFKTDVLRKVKAWDPYNVTEDADLGVRITQQGYRVGIVNSTTYEEANNHAGNWIRQRSRWIKGYMQTFLVHMRNPFKFYQSVGHIGFWGFVFFIGGTVVSTLLAPILYGFYFIWLFTRTTELDQFFPTAIVYISLFNLLIGNGMLIYISMIGAFKRHYYSLIPFALTVPVYWIMMSIAAYKALSQLIFNPFYWEKTEHGITSHEHKDTKAAKPKVGGNADGSALGKSV